MSFAFTAERSTDCPETETKDTFTRLCQNVDDIVCKDIPDRTRRSCDERDKTIIHSGMTASEVYHFSKGCIKSAATSFAEFFTKFLPELCKAIWELSKGLYNTVTSPGLFSSLKGVYESARSMASDVYEAIHQDPGLYFAHIWNKIVDAVGPMVANYECLSPQSKVENICGFIGEWVMPPAFLAKVIVRGSKGAKELIELGLIAKAGKKRALATHSSSEALPRLSFKAYRQLFKKYKELGYTIDDFKLMDLQGNLHKIKPEDLKPIDTVEGQRQYAMLTGKADPPPPPRDIPPLESADDSYKSKYALERKLPANSNQDFINHIQRDAAKKATDVLYFDVENAFQKTLNDQVFADKKIVDAINNSFFNKFYDNLRNSPELMSRLDGEYKDYKSFRLRLQLKPGDDPKKYEKLLDDLYRKTNNDFINDVHLKQLAKQLPPRTDAVTDPINWFLSGAGDNALDANMAARAVRASRESAKAPAPKLTHFREHAQLFRSEIYSIERLRRSLSSNKRLLDKRVLEKTSKGDIIPSKAMINILRKIKPTDFSNEAEYIAKIRSQSQTIFGVALDDSTIHSLSTYFEKVNGLSPPLFLTERVIIDLNQAQKGIVSVDFTSIGVDNIYEQMKGLADINKKAKNGKPLLEQSFANMQLGVDKVTQDMDTAKEYFRKAVEKTEGPSKNSPHFSGDDGIFMPKSRDWSESDKIRLVSELAMAPDPSKFRVTFVSSHFSDGKPIPAYERSKRIVRAENLEKEIRSKIIGIEKITDLEAKTFISAIDYTPSPSGGNFNLILSGKKFSATELSMIEDAFKKNLDSASGERFGKIILANDT